MQTIEENITLPIKSYEELTSQAKLQQELINAIYTSVESAVFLIDVDITGEIYFTGLNPSAEKLLGITSQSVHGKTPEELIPSWSIDTAKIIRANYERCINEGKTIRYEAMITLQGKETSWSSALTPIKNEKNKVIKIVDTSSINSFKKNYYEPGDKKGDHSSGLVERRKTRKENEVTGAKNIEDILGIYNEKFLKAFRINPDIIGYSRLEDGTYIDVNEAFEKILGYSKEEAIGKSSIDLNLWYDEAARDGLVKLLKETGEINNQEISFRNKNGEEVKTLTSARIIEINGVKKILTTARDISEKKKIEEALAESEERFRSLAQISPVGIFENDIEGNCIYANDRVLELLQMKLDKILSGQWVDTIHEDDKEKVLKSWALTVRTGEPFNEEYRFLDEKNNVTWVLGQAIPRKDYKGKITGFIGTLTDITENKHAQQIIKESAERFESIFEQAASGICQCTVDGKFVKVNQKFCKIVGYDLDELLELNFADISHPDDLEENFKYVKQALNNEIETYSMEKRYFKKTGEIVWAVLTVSLIHDVANKARYFVGVVEDITEKKLAEEKLKQREKEYRSIFENQMYGVSIAYSDLKFARVNPAFCKMLEYSEEELINHVTFKDLTHPDDLKESAAFMKKLLKGEIEKFHLEKRYVTKSGRMINALTSLQATYDDDGKFVNCTATLMDVTGQKKAAEALRKSEEKYRWLFAVQPDALLFLDTDSLNILDANDAALKLYGYTKEELIGKKVTMLSSEPDKTENAISEKVRSVPLRYHKSKNGSVFPIEINSVTFKFGEMNAMFGAIRDATERIQDEEALRTSLNEKVTLLKEIHHRVKNNLQIISSLFQLQSKNADAKSKDLLQEGRNRVKAMALIHEKLYGSDDLAKINFGDYTKDLINFLSQTYSYNKLNVKINFSADDIHLDVDTAIPTGLIFNELISNSLKHAFPDEKSGEISVSLKNKNNKTIEINVKDNGVGVKDKSIINESKTLGIRLLNTLVDQLDGSIEFSINNGMEVIVEFPKK